MASKPPTPPPAEAHGAAAHGAAPAAAKSGGLLSWLPLILTLVLMPVLAWGTMNFLVLPKLQKSLAPPSTEGEDAAADSHGKDAKADSHSKDAKADSQTAKDPKAAATSKKSDGKTKVLAPLSKVLVNVFGTGGARYLIVSMTLVGTHSDFKAKVDENKDQLIDAAASTLASKTITDLERQGVRNQIRSELMAVFNTVLKATPVQEIYLTEFAVQ